MLAKFVGSFVKVNAWQGAWQGGHQAEPKAQGKTPKETQEKTQEKIKNEFCFIGRSNSGKSSLLASLLQNPSLVKTSKRPGHTQTINIFDCDKFYLVDLPGYGFAKVSQSVKNQIHRVIDDYFKQSLYLKAVFLTLDARRDLEEEEISLAHLLRERQIPVVLALTKTDKLNQKELSALTQKIINYDLHFHLIIKTSALKKKGQNEMLHFINSY